jgi:hypothetical protein
VLTDAGFVPTKAGTPQGGVISPLLANIYLHRLDVEVREAGFRLIRYADDFVILTRTPLEARAADALVRQILVDIGLEVAEAKSGVRRVAEGFDFLGFTYHGRFLRPRPAAVRRFKDQVRALTRRQAPVSLRQMIEDLNPVTRGRGNYFAMGHVVELFSKLDGWIRTRLRSKVRGSMARLVSRAKLPNRDLARMGLVSLEPLARSWRLSPVRAQPWVSRMRDPHVRF